VVLDDEFSVVATSIEKKLVYSRDPGTA